MIIDKLENFCNYNFRNRKINKAMKFILNTDFRNKESGKYEIEGDELFYFVSNYKTKTVSESDPELHKKYIDIQYMAEGSEKIGYAPFSRQKAFKKYKAATDIAFYKCDLSFLTLTKGMFAIIYTMELHQPGILLKEPEYVKKIVFKVRDS